MKKFPAQSVLKEILQNPAEKMPCLNEENYPEVIRFLRLMDIDERDSDGRRILPNVVSLFEAHFEKSEETYQYVVSSFSEDFIPSKISL